MDYYEEYENLKYIKNRIYKVKKSKDDIIRAINPYKKRWFNILDCNCYAYALGIDIPEFRIAYGAFQPGILGSLICDSDILALVDLSYEERLLFDLNALGIKINEEGDINWKIALFENSKFFHFLKQNTNGIWYHKQGYYNSPSNLDSDYNIMEDIDRVIIRTGNGEYKKVNEYYLSLRR